MGLGLLAPPVRGWVYVDWRFDRFLASLAISENQFDDGARKQAGVRSTLNKWYYGHGSEDLNSRLIGSWGKQLRVRPPRDIDILFVLPWSVYLRFEQRTGNRQSQLLQEVRDVLGKTYSKSEMGGDGQVVVVRFDTMPVEVVPAFLLNDGRYLICDTNNGGCYRFSDPESELAVLETSDQRSGGATRRLIRMCKQWQRHCNVPIKSFLIERLAVAFLSQWTFAPHWNWHDWMLRDFFEFIVAAEGRSVVMPGTDSLVPLGRDWASKARTAFATATTACELERFNFDRAAADKWQSLLGPGISAYI